MAEPILRDVSNTPESPLYPEDTKAGSFALMLDMARVEQSSTWLLAAPDLRPWLLMLWAKAWLQVPAGTLPDDDAIIAAMIGMPDTNFAVHRRTIMRGWTRCSDGRLYHRYLTSCVLRMIDMRTKSWHRTLKARAQAIDSEHDTRKSPASNMDMGLGLGTALPQTLGAKVDNSVDKWWSTPESKARKAASLGITAYPGETAEAFYQRIRKANAAQKKTNNSK